MRFSSANTPRSLLLALSLLQALCFAQLASADRVVINNGLAPPIPDNVLDDATYADDGVYIRNVGCGNSQAWAHCADPGDPTASEMLEGGQAAY